VKEGGDSLEEQHEVFQRYWSAKEAFVKARGDGMVFDLGRVEFRWAPLEDDGTAFKTTAVIVDGVAAPLWTCVQHKLPCEQPHWVTVARGPLCEIVDVNGEFTSTLRQPQDWFTPEQWHDILNAPSPECTLLSIEDLVPKSLLADYRAARLHGAAMN